MFLIFDQVYRTESRLISELARKIKKSNSFSTENKDQEEIYHLDNLKIVFNVIDSTLAVFDKSGKEIVTMNCKYNADDGMQIARSNWFHHLLCEVARTRAEKEKQKEAKTPTAQEAASNGNPVAGAVANALQQHWQIMATALEKIRGL